MRMKEPDTVTADIDLPIGKRRLQTRISIPVLPMSPSALLPIARALADATATAASEEVAEVGKPVTCRAGCGACCRQLVPVTRAEARRLREVIEELPEPRRGTVRQRFTDARERLQQVGMLGQLEHATTLGERETPNQLGIDYFHLGIPCPFLEDESCSIYHDRPLQCRQYLVVTPPELCVDPIANQVAVVKLAFDTFQAQTRAEAEPTREVRWVPLILADEWAKANPEPAPSQPGTLLVRRLFAEVAGKDILPPQQEEPCPNPA